MLHGFMLPFAYIGIRSPVNLALLLMITLARVETFCYYHHRSVMAAHSHELLGSVIGILLLPFYSHECLYTIYVVHCCNEVKSQDDYCHRRS